MGWTRSLQFVLLRYLGAIPYISDVGAGWRSISHQATSPLIESLVSSPSVLFYRGMCHHGRLFLRVAVVRAVPSRQARLGRSHRRAVTLGQHWGGRRYAGALGQCGFDRAVVSRGVCRASSGEGLTAKGDFQVLQRVQSPSVSSKHIKTKSNAENHAPY